MKVGEFIIGPKHKPAERTAIYDKENNDHITEENKGVLAKKQSPTFGHAK